jgi:hypothetical protein
VISRDTRWRIAGEEVGGCNCDWSCPCQFEARPTNGGCEGFALFDVTEGHFGDVRLDGLRFASLTHSPGAVYEGGGTRQLIIHDSASGEQRDALEAMERGECGGTYWEIFASVCPTRLPTLSAAIELAYDRERREATIRIGNLLEAEIEPIRSPATGEQHRARIVLPHGFEFHEAEVANTVEGRSMAKPPLSFVLKDSYAQLNAFDWTND